MQIVFTGDVMLGRLVNSVLCNNKFTYVWGDTLDIIRNADVSLINLECVISSVGEEWNKTFKMFHFRAHPDAIKVLKIAQIDYVSLANNHVLDYNNEALVQMLNLLDESEIKHSGAGRNLKEALEPVVLKICKRTELNKKNFDGSSKTDDVEDISKVRIGIVSLTDNEPQWEATESLPGINYIPIKFTKHKEKEENKAIADSNEVYYNRLKYSIQKAKQTSDLVIVSSHVGPHFREMPSSNYVDFAHMIIDMGADVYWGHSNHMTQGIEIYKQNKVIMYDCGDFIDDYAVDPVFRNDLSFIFLLNFECSKNKNNTSSSNSNSNSNNYCMINEIELIPTKIYDFSVNTGLLDEEEHMVISRMIKRCNYLGTNNSLVIDYKIETIGRKKRIKIRIV